MPTTETVEEIGFDVGEAFAEDEVFELELEGRRIRAMLLAIVEDGDVPYAVLESADEGDLLLARYHEEEDGSVRLGPVEDEGAAARLQVLIERILPSIEDEGWREDGGEA